MEQDSIIMAAQELKKMGSSNSIKRKLSADLQPQGKKISKQDCEYDSDSEEKLSLSNSETNNLNTKL